METADKIRELRERTGMTRKDFAMHIGIPLRTVEDWEAAVSYTHLDVYKRQFHR